MNAPGRFRLAIYVEPASQKWVVLDPDGNFWILPNGEDPWGRRQRFFPTQENQLVPVPAHYKSLIELPF